MLSYDAIGPGSDNRRLGIDGGGLVND